jgi:hypothetical protein
MPTFTEPDILSADIANKVHNFTSDTFRLALSNTAPAPGTTFLLANVTNITAGNGYVAAAEGAGKAVTLSLARTGQTTTVSISGTAPVWTATGGTMASFRYVIFWNDTPTSPANPVIGWIDHGSVVSMTVGQTYTLPLGALFTIN